MIQGRFGKNALGQDVFFGFCGNAVGGGEAYHDFPAAMPGIGAGAGQAVGGAPDDAFQLPVGNGKIRGYDHHDGTLIVCGGNHFGKIVGGVKKLSSHFSSLYGKIPGCAEIGLYKNAQGIDFPVQGNEPGGASDSALEAIADRALSGAHGTLFEIRAGMLQGFFYMAFIYRPAADVIDAAVVAFSYYRIDGMYGYSFFFAALNSMGDQSVGHKADIQGIGESDRSFQTAQFLYLGKPAGFAEAVLDKHAATGLDRNGFSVPGRMTVTPVLFSGVEMVEWPTRTPFTSVILLSGPGCMQPGVME